MKKPNIPKQINNLVKLQAIDNKINEIIKLRGKLPEEISLAKNNIEEIKQNLKTAEQNLEDMHKMVAENKLNIKSKQSMLEKYEKQQMNVRNNREYNAITKEIELHSLDIQLAEKAVKGIYIDIKKKEVEIVDIKSSIEKLTSKLQEKIQELAALVDKNKVEEENELKEKYQALSKKTDAELVAVYERIRNRFQNRLALVNISRSACGGCFIVVPPQLEIDLKRQEKIMLCEYCGRILANVESESIVT